MNLGKILLPLFEFQVFSLSERKGNRFPTDVDRVVARWQGKGVSDVAHLASHLSALVHRPRCFIISLS